jgi:NAD(P)-dependent dehydrogenase (short-subunit alcohol dehydrogenase family)
MTQAALKRMKKGSTIVNTTSITAYRRLAALGSPGQVLHPNGGEIVCG